MLVNPVSGGGGAPRAVAQVVPLLEAAGAPVVVVPTRSAEHARDEVAAACAADEVVVAAGGDGMLASVAGPVVDAGGTLGIVPSGRGNDFARMLGLVGTRAEPPAVARTLLEAEPEAVDVIRVQGARHGDERVVLGSLYAGVDSLASELVDGARRLPAVLQYPYAAVRALLTYRPGEVVVTVDGVEHRHRAYTVVVANSGYYGKGMRIAPAADLRDGLLDVVVLPAGSRWGMVRRLPRVYDGTHVDLPEVVVLRGAEVRVEAGRPGEEGPVAYGDGELLGPLPRTARVAPGGLRVLVGAPADGTFD
ncbi:diacylglycerol kinase family lipid kinase [Nocardioides sp. HDW12B]|nr:diacylglycerol kinase family lipid kinase [Nocardioides sp. HDW12B]